MTDHRLPEKPRDLGASVERVRRRVDGALSLGQSAETDQRGDGQGRGRLRGEHRMTLEARCVVTEPGHVIHAVVKLKNTDPLVDWWELDPAGNVTQMAGQDAWIWITPAQSQMVATELPLSGLWFTATGEIVRFRDGDVVVITGGPLADCYVAASAIFQMP